MVLLEEYSVSKMGFKTGVGEIFKLKFIIINNGIISSEGMSGSDQRALNWSRMFILKGHEVTLIIPEQGKERYKGLNCIITVSDSLSGGIGLAAGYFLRGIKASQMLYKRLKKNVKDNTVISSSSDLLPDAMPAIFSKIMMSELKWIAGLHLIAPNPFKGFKKISIRGYAIPSISNIYYFFSQRLIMRFMKRYTHTVMVSNSMDRDFLIKKGFVPDKVIVTYGAVDWDAINKADKKEPGYDACYIGRFHEQKGFFDLIEAWKLVCDRFPNSVMAVIGSDINFDDVVKRVKDKGLFENIKFMGFLNGIDKFTVMKSSKICIFPSTYESFGMVVAEAMACGLPVVAYDLPVYREIYPVGMIKADIGDIKGLAEKIIKLFSNKEARQRMSKEAYESSQRFNWEKTADMIIGRFN